MAPDQQHRCMNAASKFLKREIPHKHKSNVKVSGGIVIGYEGDDPIIIRCEAGDTVTLIVGSNDPTRAKYLARELSELLVIDLHQLGIRDSPVIGE